jgi:hypothetical protein
MRDPQALEQRKADIARHRLAFRAHGSRLEQCTIWAGGLWWAVPPRLARELGHMVLLIEESRDEKAYAPRA